MSNYNFPSALNPGALAWLSEYNASMQKISSFCFCMWYGVPLWTTYEGPYTSVVLEVASSEPFGKAPNISENDPFDTLNRQFYGITQDRGRKQFGSDTPDRLDTGIADILRVAAGGYVHWVHSETPGTPAYFDVISGGISSTTGTKHVGIFMPDNEIMIYPNRE